MTKEIRYEKVVEWDEISFQEANYLFLIFSLIMSVILMYFVPQVLAVIFVPLIAIIFSIYILLFSRKVYWRKIK